LIQLMVAAGAPIPLLLAGPWSDYEHCLTH